MKRDRHRNINEQQIKLELPDSIRKQLAEHAELLGLTESQAIVYILSHYLNNSSWQDKSKFESSSVLTNYQSDDDLPDDEPDEILWDFLEPEHNSTRLNLQDDTDEVQAGSVVLRRSTLDSDFLDEPDEIIQDFIEPFREDKTSDG